MHLNTFALPKFWIKLIHILPLSLVLILLSCSPTDKASSKLPEMVDLNKTKIVIEKSKYRLQLFEGSKLLKSYPVVLGFDPVEDKWQEGDGRTPEGVFKVKMKYAHDKWSKFIWIDYPNKSSWDKFNARKASGKLGQEASIGGEIGIHGTLEGREDLIETGYNWTLGCISLKRSDVDELYEYVQEGTSIEIKH